MGSLRVFPTTSDTVCAHKVSHDCCRDYRYYHFHKKERVQRQIMLAKAIGKREGKFLTRPMAESSIGLAQSSSRASVAPKERNPRTTEPIKWKKGLQRRQRKISISLGKPAVAGWGSDVWDTNTILKLTLSNQYYHHRLTSARLCSPTVSVS